MTTPIDIGWGAVDRSNWQAMGGGTVIDLTNPADDSGILDVLQICPHAPLTGLKMGTFSGTAPNFALNDFITIGNAAAGTQTYSGLTVRVTLGDYLGFYFSSGGYMECSTVNAAYSKTGDWFVEGSQAYTSYARQFSTYGTGYTSPPLLTTEAISGIGKTTCIGNGTITHIGSANATRRGFCYKEASEGEPTVADAVAYDEGDYGIGAFTKEITGLTPGLAYRVRAYAVNPIGVGYGETISFNTLISATYTEILTSDRALALDNTTPFTPIADYEPATKKYVDGRVSDEIYSVEWDGVTDLSPSKNAVYDKIQGLVAGGGMGDFMADGSTPMTDDIVMDGHQVTGLGAPGAIGETIRQTAKITEASLESAIDNDPSSLLTEQGSILVRNSTVPVELKHGEDGQVLTTKGEGAEPVWAFGTASFGLTIDSGSAEIATGIKGYITIPYACTIVAWYITGDPIGSVVIDVWKAAGVLPTADDSIAGTEKPTLVSASVNSDTALTTWPTVTVSAGDVVGFNVISNVNCKKISLVIKVAK